MFVSSFLQDSWALHGRTAPQDHWKDNILIKLEFLTRSVKEISLTALNVTEWIVPLCKQIDNVFLFGLQNGYFTVRVQVKA